MHELKRYVTYSLIGHLAFLFLAMLISFFQGMISQKFVVFGAYSRKNSKTFYRNSTVPFLNRHSSKGSSSGNSRHNKKTKQAQRIAQKKALKQKAQQARRKRQMQKHVTNRIKTQTPIGDNLAPRQLRQSIKIQTTNGMVVAD